MNHLLLVLFVAMVLLVGPAGAMAQEQNDSQAPGSVLVFHKFLTGTVTGPNESVLPVVEFELSVTCPVGEICAEGQGVKLMAHWVCPGGGTIACRERNFRLTTTVNGTLFFNPENIEPTNVPRLPTPPCSNGYLIVWVVDNFDRPIKFDGLVGNALLRPHKATGAYNALPIQANCDPDPVTGACRFNTGDLVLLSPTGGLIFDGVNGHYRAVTGTVFGTLRYPRTVPLADRIDTHLTLLTLDVRSNRPNFPTFVDLAFFTSDEEVVSDTVQFTCWTEVHLLNIDRNLNEVFMGRKGLVKSVRVVKVPILGVDDTAGPVTLVGIIDTEEFVSSASQAEYTSALYNDGNPVATTFEPNP